MISLGVQDYEKMKTAILGMIMGMLTVVVVVVVVWIKRRFMLGRTLGI